MNSKIAATWGQFLRYGVSGGSAFVVYFVLLFACTEYFAFHHLVSLVVAYVISIFVNFTISRFFVFRSKNAAILKEAVSFFLVAMVGLVLQALIVWVGVEILELNYLLMNILASGVVYGVSFTLNKFLTFRNE
jgi:putative flippase GtrA